MGSLFFRRGGPGGVIDHCHHCACDSCSPLMVDDGIDGEEWADDKGALHSAGLCWRGRPRARITRAPVLIVGLAALRIARLTFAPHALTAVPHDRRFGQATERFE